MSNKRQHRVGGKRFRDRADFVPNAKVASKRRQQKSAPAAKKCRPMEEKNSGNGGHFPAPGDICAQYGEGSRARVAHMSRVALTARVLSHESAVLKWFEDGLIAFDAL